MTHRSFLLFSPSFSCRHRSYFFFQNCKAIIFDMMDWLNKSSSFKMFQVLLSRMEVATWKANILTFFPSLLRKMWKLTGSLRLLIHEGIATVLSHNFRFVLFSRYHRCVNRLFCHWYLSCFISSVVDNFVTVNSLPTWGFFIWIVYESMTSEGGQDNFRFVLVCTLDVARLIRHWRILEKLLVVFIILLLKTVCEH